MVENAIGRLKRLDDHVNTRDLTRLGGRIAGRYFTEQDEPQRAYLWEVKVKSEREPKDNLYLYARDVSIPEQTNDPITKQFLGKTFHYGGKNSSSKTVNVTFWDDEQLQIYAYFQRWMNWMQYYDGSQVYKENYIKDFVLTLKDRTDLFDTGTFTMKAAFPTNIGEVSLSYENNEIMQFTITLTYDTIYMSRGEEGNILTNAI